MTRILDIAVVLLPLLHLAVAICYGLLFFTERKLEKQARWLLYSTLIAHTGHILLLWFHWKQFPAASLSQGLSIVGLSIAAVYAGIEHQRKEAGTGFWVLSQAFLFTLLAWLFYGGPPPDREILHSPLFAAHVSAGLLGCAAFGLAAGYAFLFLRMYRELKKRRFSLFFGKLPPLEILERMMLGTLLTGFLALTGAVISGAIWAQQIRGYAWLADNKIVVTLILWAFYGLVLVLRRIRRWQGRQTAWASLAGFAVLLFSFVAVNLFFTQTGALY